MKDRSELISRLLGSRQSRESYIRSKLSILIPSQLRGLRLKHPMTQKELGDAADMKQSRISAMERPGETQFNVETLIRLAAALKIGLMVKFVPFSEMLRWENRFSQDSFDVLRINDDAEFITSPTTAQSRPNVADSAIGIALGSRPTANVSAVVGTYTYPTVEPPAFRVEREGFYEAVSGSTRTSVGIR